MIKKLINKYQVFIKYILSAGFCFALDLLLFYIFNSIYKVSFPASAIVLATVSARIITSVINYMLNRNKVFKNNDGKFDKVTFVKYVSLVIIQATISFTAVTLIYQATHFNETLIKIPVDVILFIINYFIQKLLIFNKEKKERKERSNKTLFFFAILTACSFIINPILTDEMLKVTVRFNVLSYAMFSWLFYLFYKKFYNKTKRYGSFNVISIIFTLLLVLGYSFHYADSGVLVYGDIQYIAVSIIKLFGFNILINLLLNMAYEYTKTLKFKEVKPGKFVDYFKAHPFKTSFIVMSIVYGIYLIAYYPGVVGYDPSYQIKEYMGIPNFYSESINITSNTMITQFNPVIHTLIIGFLFNIGHSIGYDNFGILLYTLIQMGVYISILSYTIKFMKDEGVPTKVLLIILGLYVFVPFFPFYSICAFKDTYFSIFYVLYTLYFYKFIKYNASKKDTIMLILSALLVCAFRHNGIHTVILSIIFLLFRNKQNVKKVLLSIAIIVCVYTGYGQVLKYYEITPTSPREVLSIPIQQTAALIVNNEDIIEPEDREIIAKIIDYDMVKENYNPELSDPVKNTFNKDATNEDLINYLKVWFKYLFKKPITYIEATINNVYGYFYPDAQKWYFYYKKYEVLNEVGLDYHYVGPGILRAILMGYGFIFQYFPVIGLLTSIGFTTWIYIYLVGSLIESNKKKYIKLLLPAFLLILVCIVGPINTYYRYILPYSMSLPMILALLYVNKNEK